MSKKMRARKFIAAVVAAACAACALAAGPSAGARQKVRQSAAVPRAVNAKTAAVREATAEVLRETSELRKLPVLRQVRSGAQSREEIEKMLVRNLNQNTTPEEVHAAETALKKLGLVPPEFRLRETLLKILTEQVAGYYDPKAREFYLADWIDLDGQKPVMAHELTHALQDQHFNLRRFQDWPRHDSDAELAAHALVEGDASLLMTHYLARNLLRQFAFMKAMVSAGIGSTEQLDNAPRVLRESLIFPYMSGSAWVGHVHKRGGWEAVTAAYKNLPKSTEQILHPDKYFAGDLPQKVAVRDISSSLGKGWRLADHDVEGEWGYYLLLDQFLNAADTSKKAAEGWGGDRYALFLGPTPSDVLVALKSTWDTEADAREFFDAYASRTSKRYATEPAEQSETGPGSRRALWTTSEGAVLVELSGRGVTIIEGIPAGVDAKAVLKAL